MTLLSGAPLIGLQMTAYTMLTDVAPRAPDGSLPMVYMLLAGAFAGIFSQSVTFPGDTIRRRMQNNGANGVARLYTGSWVRERRTPIVCLGDFLCFSGLPVVLGVFTLGSCAALLQDCTVKIWRNEGLLAFYRGWGSNTTRAIPGSAIQFAAYETFRKMLGVDRV